MARKGKQTKGGDSAAPQSTGSAQSGKAKQADSEVWAALKHQDEEELLQLLFDEIDDAESGERLRVAKPTARKAVNQANAKKVYPLSYAVSEGLDRSLIELLLRAGAAVNKKDESAQQSTALHGACWCEDGEAVDMLLRAGADPRVVDGDGRTPLHVLATSNASELLLTILDRIGGDGGDAGVPPSSAALKLDPLAVLAIPDKAQGATVLHLALAESTYNFGVAQALCDYLERAATTAAPAVAALVSAKAAAASGESPLHALVSAANAEDAVVTSLVRRLLAVGADPLARTTDGGQSVLDTAVSSRPGCSSKSAEQLYGTLLAAVFAADASGAALVEKNTAGQALIHVAVAAANLAAVRALCAAVPAEKTVALLGDVATADGVSVVELLATREGGAEIAHALIAAGAVAADTYAGLRQTHEQLRAERAEAESDEGEEAGAAGSPEESDGDAAPPAAGESAALAQLRKRQGTAAGGGGASGGINRVQQARRARAATAAQRKHNAASSHHSNEEDGAGGVFSGELSTPVKVVGVLLLLSLFVSAYSMLFGFEDASLHGA